MMKIETLHAHLDDAEADVDRAAETAARAHQDAPGTALESDALDDLVTALAAREMWTRHLSVAQAEREADEAGDEAGA